MCALSHSTALVLCKWLILFNIMSPWFQFVARGRIILIEAECHPDACMCHIPLMHSSVDGHLGRFHLTVVVTSTE